MKGITEEQEKIIKNILQTYSEFEFFYYGSRVKGNFVKSSDLDILVKGSIDDFTLDEIGEKFENSTLPFIVNLSAHNVMEKDFYNLIKSDLVKVL